MWSIRAKLQLERRTGDLAIFNLAIDSKLIGCDLVALRVDEVTCRPTGTLSTDQLSAEEKGSGRPLRTERSHTPGAGRLPAGERPESGRMPAPERTVRYLGVEVGGAYVFFPGEPVVRSTGHGRFVPGPDLSVRSIPLA